MKIIICLYNIQANKNIFMKVSNLYKCIGISIVINTKITTTYLDKF